jgi:hypothetical protein
MPILGVIASSRLTTVPDGAELISTQNVSGVGTVTFSSLNTYTQYDHLELHWNLNTTAGLYLRMRFNGDTGGSSDYIAKNTIANYNGSNNAVVSAGDYPGGNTSANRIGDAPLPRTADATPGVTTGYCLLPMFNASLWHSYLAQGGGARYVGGQANAPYVETFGGQWAQATPITSLRFYMNSNTWSTGSTVSLYGWRNT